MRAAIVGKAIEDVCDGADADRMRVASGKQRGRVGEQMAGYENCVAQTLPRETVNGGYESPAVDTKIGKPDVVQHDVNDVGAAGLRPQGEEK